MHFGPNPGFRKPQYSRLIAVTSGKSHNLKGFQPFRPQDIVDRLILSYPVAHPSCSSHPFKSTLLGAWNLTRALALNNPIPEDAPMARNCWRIQQEERIDHQLVRGIRILVLTANIISSTIGAGIFVIPWTVAKGLGSAAPLAFVCCAIAMVLFVTCFAIAGSRVSLTGGLYAYVEVAFGRYVGFLAGMLYFLTALGAVAGVVNVDTGRSAAPVVPFLAGPITRGIVMFAVYGLLGTDQHPRRPSGRGCRDRDHVCQASAPVVVHLRRSIFHPRTESGLERLAEQQVVRRCSYSFDLRLCRD